MSKRVKRKSAKRPKSKLGLPDLDHSRAAVLDCLVHPSPNAAIDMRSTNSFSGTAPSQGCRSTRSLSLVTESFSRTAG
jgi:hypothetical protein